MHAGARRTKAEISHDPGKDWPHQGGSAAGQKCAKVGDCSIRLSSVQQKRRAAKVDAGVCSPMQAGCHGTSLFVQALGYVDYNNLFLVPVAHAGYHGLINGALGISWSVLFKRKHAQQTSTALHAGKCGTCATVSLESWNCLPGTLCSACVNKPPWPLTKRPLPAM